MSASQLGRCSRVALLPIAGGICLSLGWILYPSQSAQACGPPVSSLDLKQKFWDTYTTVPNISTSKLSCTVCHTTEVGGEVNINLYGLDVQKLLHPPGPTSYSVCPDPLPPSFNLTSINWVDSDGDGFSNEKEINALTFPGDPTDQPQVGAMSSTATVLGDQTDPDPTNNTATATVPP